MVCSVYRTQMRKHKLPNSAQFKPQLLTAKELQNGMPGGGGVYKRAGRCRGYKVIRMLHIEGIVLE